MGYKLNPFTGELDYYEAASGATAGGTDELVKTSSADSTAGYLGDKIDSDTLAVDTASQTIKVKGGVFASAGHTHSWSDVSKSGSKLSDIEDVPAYQADKVLGVDSSGTTLQWVTNSGGGGTAGATTYLELDDTPSSYSGHAGEVPVVKSDESGLDWFDAASAGHTHDDRYYTETETDNLLDAKADKVSGATNGNFAGLDASGNLTDSGYSAGRFLWRQGTGINHGILVKFDVTDTTTFSTVINIIRARYEGGCGSTKLEFSRASGSWHLKGRLSVNDNYTYRLFFYDGYLHLWTSISTGYWNYMYLHTNLEILSTSDADVPSGITDEVTLVETKVYPNKVAVDSSSTPDYLGNLLSGSLEISSGKAQLENDSSSPGAWKVYGTNGSGTRGWYDMETPRYTKLIAYNTDGRPEYVGEAIPGTATSASSWRIKKLTYDTDGNITAVKWADGNSNFDNVWDNRTSYSYS